MCSRESVCATAAAEVANAEHLCAHARTCLSCISVCCKMDYIKLYRQSILLALHSKWNLVVKFTCLNSIRFAIYCTVAYCFHSIAGTAGATSAVCSTACPPLSSSFCDSIVCECVRCLASRFVLLAVNRTANERCG